MVIPCLLLFLIAACQEKRASRSIEEDERAINSDSNHVEKGPAIIGDESVNSYVLPLDCLLITYNQVRDTLFGYRSGDSLIVEGDMIFLYDKEKFRSIGTTKSRWPISNDVIVIPYRINNNYRDIARIDSALDMWREKVNVEFVKYNSSFHRNFVEFVSSNVTRSFVGKIGGRQTIELASWATRGNIAHEVGHAMGLYHEQSRSDRDKYVSVSCSRDVNFRHAYRSDPYARDIGPYNYYSIMHYGPSSCMQVINGLLPRGIPGQRDSISSGDSRGVSLLYDLQEE